MTKTGKSKRGRASASETAAKAIAAQIRDLSSPRVVRAPDHLDKAGRDLFDRIVEQYGIADAAGVALLTTACECLDRVREAQAIIKKHGHVVETGTGGLKTNPAHKIETDARNGMLAAFRGLSLEIPQDVRR